MPMRPVRMRGGGGLQITTGPRYGVRAWYREARRNGWPLLRAIRGAWHHGR
jgi:hypothetical protein